MGIKLPNISRGVITGKRRGDLVAAAQIELLHKHREQVQKESRASLRVAKQALARFEDAVRQQEATRSLSSPDTRQVVEQEYKHAKLKLQRALGIVRSSRRESARTRTRSILSAASESKKIAASRGDAAASIVDTGKLTHSISSVDETDLVQRAGDQA